MERYPVIDRHERHPGNAAETFGVLVETVLGATVHLGVLAEGYRPSETTALIDEVTLAPQELPTTIANTHELVGDDPLDTREALQRTLFAKAYDLAA